METLNVERFIEIQDESNNYETALKEITNGKKQSHWIWYIFPQMKGLGHSTMSQRFGINSLDEAKAYWANGTLRERLKRITEALLTHKDKSAEDILGGIDARKVKSRMTLFDIVSPHDVFDRVLNAFYGGKRCRATLNKFNIESRNHIASNKPVGREYHG